VPFVVDVVIELLRVRGERPNRCRPNKTHEVAREYAFSNTPKPGTYRLGSSAWQRPVDRNAGEPPAGAERGGHQMASNRQGASVEGAMKAAGASIMRPRSRRRGHDLASAAIAEAEAIPVIAEAKGLAKSFFSGTSR
jgi:hypothetical protein